MKMHHTHMHACAGMITKANSQSLNNNLWAIFELHNSPALLPHLNQQGINQVMNRLPNIPKEGAKRLGNRYG